MFKEKTHPGVETRLRLLRKFYSKHPGAKPSEKELRRLADRMGMHDDAVSDAMGLAGYGKIHSES